MIRLLPMVLIIVAIFFGAAYFMSSMQSLDAGTDTQATAYEEASTDTTGAAQTTVSIISAVASIVGVALLLVAVFGLRRGIG